MSNSSLWQDVLPNEYLIHPTLRSFGARVAEWRSQRASSTGAQPPASGQVTGVDPAKPASDCSVFFYYADEEFVHVPNGDTRMAKLHEHLKSLGENSTGYVYDEPVSSILECFPNPMGKGADIEITAPEFTSLCPKTGQPDFATILIRYEPIARCVESKSLKLYLGAFRMQGMFHEAVVAKICHDLVTLLEPRWITVQGQFTPRGGIKFWPLARWHQQDEKQPPNVQLY